jgi:putative transposase
VASGTWTKSSYGEQKYLWRVVGQDGNVLAILVQKRRDKDAARRFFRRLMKKTRMVARVVVTDKLRSYGRRRPPRGHALGGTSLAQGPERPGGEQPPTHQTARTRDETLPLSGRSAAVHLRVQRHLTPLPPPPPSDARLFCFLT